MSNVLFETTLGFTTPEEHGAIVNNPAFDNKPAFDAAFATGLPVLMNVGTYWCSEIKPPNRGALEGRGWRSMFKSINGSDRPVISLSDPVNEQVRLRNFAIDGNKANQTLASAHGIHINGTTSGSSQYANSWVPAYDPRHLIENILIINTKGDGFRIDGGGENHIRNVQTLYCDGTGFYINSYDNWLESLSAGQCGGRGIWLTATAANCRLTNSKAWFTGLLATWDGTTETGQSEGFYLEAQRCTFAALESQDTRGHGFYIKAKRSSFAGIRAEAAGRIVTDLTTLPNKVGIALDTAQYNAIAGFMCMDPQPNQAMANGLRLIGGSNIGNNCSGVVNLTLNDSVPIGDGTTPSTINNNRFSVNSVDYRPSGWANPDKLQNGFMWLSSANKLMVKSGAVPPTSDTDGTVVGTQT